MNKKFTLIQIGIVLFLGMVLVSYAFCDNFEKKRALMIKDQIKARDIKDSKVIDAMAKVSRHEFVPAKWRNLAYEDMSLPLGFKQTISQPYVIALMIELLALKGDEKILEIGTGSGYQAAILAEIVPEVYSIEIIPKLANLSKQRLELLGYKNIKVLCSDGYYGLQSEAPYDGIIVTCGAQDVPPALIRQLKEGGRMVIPVGEGHQKLLFITKRKGKIITKFITDVSAVPVLGETR